jgi:ribonuclease D
VASNNVLKELTRVAPRTVEGLAEVPDLRRWQAQKYGTEWVELINRVLGAERPESEGNEEVSSDGGRRRRRRRGEAPAPVETVD